MEAEEPVEDPSWFNHDTQAVKDVYHCVSEGANVDPGDGTKDNLARINNLA